MAVEVLTTADGRAKTALGRAPCRRLVRRARGGHAPAPGAGHAARALPAPTARTAGPARRAAPPPRHAAGRIALLHAVAHIELNAVDLHWDIIARFTDHPMPLGFYDDWVKAADEEAKHFNLICDCLEAMGSHYGALPAHAGMWRAAEDTADDLLGRLAVVPMVLEARGLDVTPGMIDIFRKAGDSRAHGRAGDDLCRGSRPCRLWLEMVPLPVRAHELDPKDIFHDLVRKYFHGALKPPFNEEKRAEAGLPPDFYWPLTDARSQIARLSRFASAGFRRHCRGFGTISHRISNRVATPCRPLLANQGEDMGMLPLGSGFARPFQQRTEPHQVTDACSPIGSTRRSSVSFPNSACSSEIRYRNAVHPAAPGDAGRRRTGRFAASSPGPSSPPRS
jgi:uncharacterized ferritin-like protein (DUF455 family)